MDAETIPVPAGELEYEEDPEEVFIGPVFGDDSLEEEYDDLEISEEQSGAQSGQAALQITYNPGLVSQYTHRRWSRRWVLWWLRRWQETISRWQLDTRWHRR